MNVQKVNWCKLSAGPGSCRKCVPPSPTSPEAPPTRISRKTLIHWVPKVDSINMATQTDRTGIYILINSDDQWMFYFCLLPLSLLGIKNTITIRSSTQISVTAPSLWGAHTSGLPRGSKKLDSQQSMGKYYWNRFACRNWVSWLDWNRSHPDHLKQHHDHLRFF